MGTSPAKRAGLVREQPPPADAPCGPTECPAHARWLACAGLGLANLVGATWSAYPTTGGFSRSAVNAETGAVSGDRGWRLCPLHRHSCRDVPRLTVAAAAPSVGTGRVVADGVPVIVATFLR